MWSWCSLTAVLVAFPDFPGARPQYAITKRELQEYWDSPRPVVFVTDFLRKPEDPTDPPTLNLPLNAGEPLLVVGPRKLYGNQAASQRWVQQQDSDSTAIDQP